MNLVVRVISAAILLPIAVVLIHLGGNWMFGLGAVVSATCCFEYSGMVSPSDTLSRTIFIVFGTLITGVGMYTTDLIVGFVVMQLAAVLLTLLFTLRTGRFDTAWQRLSVLTFGLLYVSLPVASFYRLRSIGEPLGGWSASSWLFVALIATWSNDTFAYFAGRTFGKHKFYPKVSPNKTWEGFFGGAFGAVSMLFVARFAAPAVFGHLTIADLLFIGIPAAVLGPMGDLAESMLKRNFGVKDSGNTIPGHGGLLDRVDALFFVAPWVLFYAVGIKPFLASIGS